MVIIDTNIIIDHLRQVGRSDTLLMQAAKAIAKENLAISVISVQELYEGRSTRDFRKEEYLLATITPLRILPYTYEVAEQAGRIARDLSQPIEFVDAAIAATALVFDGQLLTLNHKDFQHIKGLEFWRPES